MDYRIVLSLFDGMSCLQIALKDRGDTVGQYYSSEIDKHAIAQTTLNFPNPIHLGDVTKWREWNIDWSQVDLIGAGSPCQGFSFAGKQLAFDDPRSVLFFVFIEILNHCQQHNHKVKFLLENVDMKKEYIRVISEHTKVFPVNINSNLVSAQNRNRWYWSNIRTKTVGLFNEIHTDIPQPKDKGILLKDILDEEVDEKFYIKSESVAALIRYNDRQKENNRGFSAKFRDTETTDKMDCLKIGGGAKDDLICVAMRGRGDDNTQQLESNNTNKTNTITSATKDNLIMQINPCLESGGKQPYQQNRIYDTEGITPALCANKSDLLIKEATVKGYTEIKLGGCFDFENPNSKTRRGRKMDIKSNSLMSQNMAFYNYTKDYRIRRLTPNECAKLQTIPSWYQWGCSDTQIYRMLGNGWTVEVIKWILSYNT